MRRGTLRPVKPSAERGATCRQSWTHWRRRHGSITPADFRECRVACVAPAWTSAASSSRFTTGPSRHSARDEHSRLGGRSSRAAARCHRCARATRWRFTRRAGAASRDPPGFRHEGASLARWWTMRARRRAAHRRSVTRAPLHVCAREYTGEDTTIRLFGTSSGSLSGTARRFARCAVATGKRVARLSCSTRKRSVSPLPNRDNILGPRVRSSVRIWNRYVFSSFRVDFSRRARRQEKSAARRAGAIVHCAERSTIASYDEGCPIESMEQRGARGSRRSARRRHARGRSNHRNVGFARAPRVRAAQRRQLV